MTQRFIPTHGGYRKLFSYQKSEIIYDATIYFTKRFFRLGDRTIDQMVQAARSGKQNIAEASMASGTSKEMEIKLTSVDRSSLEEFLYLKNPSYDTFRKGIEHENPEICANVIIGLIKVTSFLLHKQICRLEADFLQQGGLRERMTKARLASRTSFEGRRRRGH